MQRLLLNAAWWCRDPCHLLPAVNGAASSLAASCSSSSGSGAVVWASPPPLLAGRCLTTSSAATGTAASEPTTSSSNSSNSTSPNIISSSSSSSGQQQQRLEQQQQHQQQQQQPPPRPMRTRLVLAALRSSDAPLSSRDLHARGRELYPADFPASRARFKRLVAWLKRAGWVRARPPAAGRGSHQPYVLTATAAGLRQPLDQPAESWQLRLARKEAAAIKARIAAGARE